MAAIRAKTAALVLLGLVSLLDPLIERWVAGRVDPMGAFDLAGTFVSLALVFWWYHVDKRERNYQAGPLMNMGVIALSALALPVYFVRSRGWKRGMMATAVAAAVLGAAFALSEVGERIGAAFAS